jgi:CHAD domain-containing protein
MPEVERRNGFSTTRHSPGLGGWARRVIELRSVVYPSSGNVLFQSSKMLTIAPPISVMVRNDKWIEAESGNEPLSEVARRVISARLKTVCGWLPQAAEDGLHDGESVHQMRVATRRAMVALDLFAPLLSHRKCNWFRKHLKRIRKTAGPARDLDVMAKRLTVDVEHGSDPAMAAGLTELLDQVADARCDAQSEIVRLRRKLKRVSFSRRAKKLAGKVRWRDDDSPEPTFHAAAAESMRMVVAEFFATAEAELDCTRALHNIRLAAKRLRYAMEVFADAFGPAFRSELYPLVAELQEKLGTVNDHVTAREQYSEWLGDQASEPQRTVLNQLIAQEAAAIQQSTSAFRQWWTPQRAAEHKSRFLREISPNEARCA